MKFSKLFFLVFYICPLSGFTQDEVLEDIYANPYLSPIQAFNSSRSTLLYQIDTLSLPFLEDFSINRLKQYNASENDSELILIPWMHYTYNLVFVDTLRLMFSQTYSYDYNFNTFQYDSFPNAQVSVNIYSPVFPFGLDTSFTAWPAKSIYTLGSVIKEVELPADTVLYNQRDTFLVVPDDGYSYWTDNNVYINNHYAVDPPTFGVATFDGLDSTGYPYNFSMSQGNTGAADVLTSKPFSLDQSMANVFLSFFYQPQGYGNAPEAKDSLVLEFYAPSANKWLWQWSVPGESEKPFQEVFIPIADALFLQPGFRFRFRNYATLSGALDHWNLDYIRLDENRSQNDEIDDVAFQYQPPSLLKTYTAVPFDHYKTSFMSSSFDEQMNNLSNSAKFVVNEYLIYDQYDNLLFTSSPVTNGNAPANTAFAMNHSITYNFPLMNAKAKFSIVHTTNTTPDINRDNDTIVKNQVFDTYYAYDDGTAEQGYALVGTGAMLAYQFSLSQQDTLKGVLMYFPPMLENISLRSFRISVWNDNAGTPGNIIYQSKLVNPMYTSGINTFYYYAIDDTDLVVSNTYYIGWEQTGADKIYVGFDVNTDNSDKIWYNTSGIWNSTSFTGSMMIRAAFGTPEDFPIYAETETAERPSFLLYPNPSKDWITLVCGYPHAEIRVLNLSGQTLLHQHISRKSSVDVSGLDNGLYFLLISHHGRQTAVRKFVISK